MTVAKESPQSSAATPIRHLLASAHPAEFLEYYWSLQKPWDYQYKRAGLRKLYEVEKANFEIA